MFADLLLTLPFPHCPGGHVPACVAVEGGFSVCGTAPSVPCVISELCAAPRLQWFHGQELSPGEPHHPPVPDFHISSPILCCLPAAWVAHSVWPSALLFLPLHFKHKHKPAVLQQSHPELSRKPKQTRQWPLGP